MRLAKQLSHKKSISFSSNEIRVDPRTAFIPQWMLRSEAESTPAQYGPHEGPHQGLHQGPQQGPHQVPKAQGPRFPRTQAAWVQPF